MGKIVEAETRAYPLGYQGPKNERIQSVPNMNKLLDFEISVSRNKLKNPKRIMVREGIGVHLIKL